MKVSIVTPARTSQHWLCPDFFSHSPAFFGHKLHKKSQTLYSEAYMILVPMPQFTPPKSWNDEFAHFLNLLKEVLSIIAVGSRRPDATEHSITLTTTFVCFSYASVCLSVPQYAFYVTSSPSEMHMKGSTMEPQESVQPCSQRLINFSLVTYITHLNQFLNNRFYRGNCRFFNWAIL